MTNEGIIEGKYIETKEGKYVENVDSTLKDLKRFQDFLY